MPNRVRYDSVYLGTQGNPDTFNVPISTLTGGTLDPGTYRPYAPGDLGATFEVADKAYTMVYLDSGATSATPVGSLAANQLLFWKDKAARIVTNDSRFCLPAAALPANAFRNFVAGIARVSVTTPGTGGNQIAMLVKGYNIIVSSDGTGGPGQTAIALGTAGTAQVTAVAVGTAANYQALGVMRSTPVSNLVYIDCDFDTLP